MADYSITVELGGLIFSYFHLDDNNKNKNTKNKNNTPSPVSAVDVIADPSHGRRVSVSPNKVLPGTTVKSSSSVVLNLPKYEERSGVEWARW